MTGMLLIAVCVSDGQDLYFMTGVLLLVVCVCVMARTPTS